MQQMFVTMERKSHDEIETCIERSKAYENILDCKNKCYDSCKH